MGAHAAPPGAGRRWFGRTSAALALGTCYGVLAGVVDRNAGASAGRSVLLGIAAGLVFAVVVRSVAGQVPELSRGPRATVLGTCAGAAAAFVVGLAGGAGVVRAVLTGVLLALAVGLAVYAVSARAGPGR